MAVIVRIQPKSRSGLVPSVEVESGTSQPTSLLNHGESPLDHVAPMKLAVLLSSIAAYFREQPHILHPNSPRLVNNTVKLL